MKRRAAPKARDQFNEEAATGRRRQNVHHESSRQRDNNLRARRLQAELAGAATGDASAAALVALGPDVLVARVKELVTTLQKWSELPPSELPGVLQQIVTLLSTGVYQVVEAVVAGGVVASLAALLQQPDSHMPPGVALTAASCMELIANDSLTAAQAVTPAVPALASRLAAATEALLRLAPIDTGAEAEAGADAGARREVALLQAAQLAAPLGAMAGWGAQLQDVLTEAGAPGLLLRLLRATIDDAAECVSPFIEAAAAAAQAAAAAGVAAAGLQQQQQQVAMAATLQAPGPDPAVVYCCSTALWAVGMLVRDRADAVAELVGQPALLAGLRSVLLAPAPYPELLRGVAWLVAFCSSFGGPAAVQALVAGGGLLPGLLRAAIRLTSSASALVGDDPGVQVAAQPLYRTLLPLLLACANIAADPAHALLVLTELQAARPLQPGGDGGVAVTATGVDMLLACLTGRVPHRKVQSSAAGLAAALAGGAAAAGPGAVDAARRALAATGVVPVLVELLRTGTMDVRREAAAAVALLTEGASASANADAEGGNDPRPGQLAMLCSLGVTCGGDEQGVLEAYLDLLRGFTPDAVHAALRFVTVVLREVKGGRRLVEEMDGIDALEAAQEGRSGLAAPALQMWAQELVDQYYGIDCEDDEEEVDGDEELGTAM